MSPLRKIFLSSLAVAALCLAPGMTAQADPSAFIVVPNGLETTDGNAGFAFAMGDYRNQQIYPASQFPGSVLIIGAFLRPDITQTGPATITFTDHRVFFSTTTRPVNGLSSTFADNIGADNTLVLSGPLTISTANLTGTGTARQFDIFFPLTTPFLYNPSMGNLLIDAQVVGATGTPLILDFQANDLRVATVFAAGSATGTTGTVFAFGHVEQFVVQAVPEPSTMLLLGTGLAGVAARARKRRKS